MGVRTYSRNEELGNSGKCMGETHLLCLNWSRSIQNCVVASCTAVSFCPVVHGMTYTYLRMYVPMHVPMHVCMSVSGLCVVVCTGTKKRVNVNVQDETG